MIRIFVEGRDSQFVDKYLSSLLGKNENTWEIIRAGGYTKLHLLDQQFKENTERGGLNLIIFDADRPDNGGGYESRKLYLQNKMQELSISAQLFLFPNNQEDGDFEQLLEHIVNNEHSCLLRCFESYESCISRHKDENGLPKYIIPNRKAKIYAYLESIKKSKKEAERFKNEKDFFFDRTEYWNLESEYLLPLKEFLLKAVENDTTQPR